MIIEKITKERNIPFNKLLIGEVFSFPSELTLYIKIKNGAFPSKSGDFALKCNCINLATGEARYCYEETPITPYPDAKIVCSFY